MKSYVDIENVIDKINSELVKIYNAPENFFSSEYRQNIIQNKKNPEKPPKIIEYRSICIKEPTTGRFNQLAINFYIKENKRTPNYYLFVVNNKLIDKINIPTEAEIHNVKSDPFHTQIKFYDWTDSVENFIKEILIYYTETFEPSDKFGCCSKYKECSKAKKCLHDNLFYSKACWYRKNLEAGKIFY